jgi:type III secretion protein U
MAEKSHQPTARRLREARRKGEVARSADVITAVQFIALLALLIGALPIGLRIIHSLLDAAARVVSARDPLSQMGPLIGAAVRALAMMVLTLSGLVAISAIVAGLAQVGGMLAWGRLVPELSRLNPAAGLKRMFSLRNLVDLAKTIVKTLCLTAITFAVIHGSLGAAIEVGFTSPARIMETTGKLLAMLFAWAALVYAVLAAIDYVHQRWEFMRTQKMTTEEVRREYKDTEGDPHVASRRTQLAREAQFASMQDVLRAASVVVYSSRVAVALHYAGEPTLPMVIARGEGEVAERIRAIAQELLRPTIANAGLAEKIYEDVPLGRYIDSTHFREVADALRWAGGGSSG